MMKKINKYILNAYAGLMCIPFMLIFLMEFTLEIHCPILWLIVCPLSTYCYYKTRYRILLIPNIILAILSLTCLIIIVYEIFVQLVIDNKYQNEYYFLIAMVIFFPIAPLIILGINTVITIDFLKEN
uniref:Uncharacterized protein n=1 Tax=Pseudourostyla cristata TaxID=293816 RepID=A0A4P9JMF9_9SPIT|nr:hypothetical protein [Pseudourostyla cristata]